MKKIFGNDRERRKNLRKEKNLFIIIINSRVNLKQRKVPVNKERENRQKHIEWIKEIESLKIII